MGTRRLALVTLLATIALAAIPRSALGKKFFDAIGSTERDYILPDLYEGTPHWGVRFSKNDNQHPLYLVELGRRDPVSGEYRTRLALWKPNEDGIGGYGFTRGEESTYRTNRIFGMNIAMPAAWRDGLSFPLKDSPDWAHFGGGTLQLFAPDAKSLADIRPEHWQFNRERFATDVRILTILTKMADRWSWKQYIKAPHFENGIWRPFMIDNSAPYHYEGPRATMDEGSDSLWGKIKRIDPLVLRRMNEVNWHELRADLPGLPDWAVDWTYHRAKDIAGYFNHRVEKVGAEETFFKAQELNWLAKEAVGAEATPAQLRKFAQKMARKGVKLQLVSATQNGGSAARTVLTKSGQIVVRLTHAADRPVAIGTLAEELVHVNQLRQMTKRLGATTPAALQQQIARLAPKERAALTASMEAYAKGRVASLVKSLTLEEGARVAKARDEHAAGATTVSSSKGPLGRQQVHQAQQQWRTRFGAPRQMQSRGR